MKHEKHQVSLSLYKYNNTLSGIVQKARIMEESGEALSYIPVAATNDKQPTDLIYTKYHEELNK